MDNDDERSKETSDSMLDVMVNNDTKLPIEDLTPTPYLIPYKLFDEHGINNRIIFHCKNISTKYNTYKQKRQLNAFLDQISKTNPNLSTIGIGSTNDSELIRLILQHFLQQRRPREDVDETVDTHDAVDDQMDVNYEDEMNGVVYDPDNNEENEKINGIVDTYFILGNCELSTFFFDQNYITITNNSNCTIHLFYSYIFNYYSSSNKREEIHKNIENCPYFSMWDISDCNNKDLMFILSALTRNQFIKKLRINCCKYRQLEEVMIINSITNLLSNNKNLSSLVLDFDHIPINFSSTDAISGLANALIDSESLTDLSFESICLRDSEREMLRLMLKRGVFDYFQVSTGLLSFHVFENNLEIEFMNDEDFHCNKKADENALNLLLHDISVSCSDLKSIEIPVNCSACRQHQEVTIFNSITNLVSNNVKLSSFILDFDYIPVNFSSTDAITGLAKALIDSQSLTDLAFKNVCLQDRERKMIRFILERGTLKKFAVGSSMLSFDVSENNLEIKFMKDEHFHCNKNTYEKALNLLLHDISLSCSDLKRIEIRVNCNANRQLKEVTVFDSITTLVSNNEKLSSFILDFDYIPVNFSSTDAITGLAKALIDSQSLIDLTFKNVCIQDRERKMLRLILERGTFENFELDSSVLSFHVYDNRVIVFDETHVQREYNKSTDENALNLILNDISTSCSDLKQINIDRINNEELASRIFLHFVRQSHCIDKFALRFCSAIFQYITFNDTIYKDKSIISRKRTFELEFPWEEVNIDSNDRAIIGTAIEKSRLFSSWHMKTQYGNVEDMTFVLNALSRNKCIQSLHISASYYSWIEEMKFNSLINSITNIVNHTKTLSKLVLNFDDLNNYELDSSTAAIANLTKALMNSETISSLSLGFNMTFLLNALSQNKYIQSLHICGSSRLEETQFYSVINSITIIVNHTKTLSKLVLGFRGFEYNTTSAALSNLAEALISSETINDLSLYGFEFRCNESFQSIQSIFEKKTNLRRLSIDSSLFSWKEWIEDEDEPHYKKHWFKASVFSNLLQNHINSNLHELDLECNIDNAELSQEMLLFLALLKDSNLEKLSFTTGYSSECASSVCRCLFVDVIPFMSRLHDFKFSTYNHELCDNLRETYIKAVAICNRTLIKAEWEHDYAKSNQMFVIKSIRRFLQRNNALGACIENKTHISKSAYPKVFVTTKPTGPDAAFQLLCNLRLLVGPKENTLAVKPKSALSYTISTKTPTCQCNNKRKCTVL